MSPGESATLRAAVLHMERFRNAIDAEVNRRMGRSEPPPEVRGEIVRRFRSFCRLASLSPDAARPSLDGLHGNESISLEESVTQAVRIACECGPEPDVAQALVLMEQAFNQAIRRILQPNDDAPSRRNRNRKRRTPNAGKRVRGAIDRISDTYIALSLDTGMIHDVNPAAEALFGCGSDRLLGTAFAELVAPAWRQIARDLEARLDSGEESPPVELVLSRPNGDFVTVQLSVASHMIGGKRMAIFVAREISKDLAQSLKPS
jgi:PAS domain S-box-containing protein